MTPPPTPSPLIHEERVHGSLITLFRLKKRDKTEQLMGWEKVKFTNERIKRFFLTKMLKIMWMVTG
jgi:hypothetical protein